MHLCLDDICIFCRAPLWLNRQPTKSETRPLWHPNQVSSAPARPRVRTIYLLLPTRSRDVSASMRRSDARNPKCVALTNSKMERDVEAVLGEAGLTDAAALLRANGVFNLETLRAMTGDDLDVDKLMSLSFPFATVCCWSPTGKQIDKT